MILVLLDATEKEEREQLRREFTANVSHELKTPLTSISGFAEIMKNGMVPPADMGKFAEKIYNEAQRLIALVQDIIKLSKLDEKDTSLCEEEVELDALVQEACERLQPAAERKRIALSTETEPILFRGVKQVLSEMIYNLCDNAIRYNKEGGRGFCHPEAAGGQDFPYRKRYGQSALRRRSRGGFSRDSTVWTRALCRKRRHRLRAFYCQTWCGTA